MLFNVINYIVSLKQIRFFANFSMERNHYSARSVIVYHNVVDADDFGVGDPEGLTGHGKGGRNQELALAAAIELAGVPNVALLSIGSDGTDGPTDAAGGFVDGSTYHDLREKGESPEAYLTDNDAYHALQAVDCLIKTGPTGTNVNDLVVGLILP